MVRKITQRKINANLASLATPLDKKKLRPSAGREDMIGEFYFLDTNSLFPYPNQARRAFDDKELSALSETIEKHGIRQPLTVSKIPDELGKYYVVSGERRLRAARLINLKKVPCIILNDSDHKDEIALIENLQRKDLHPLEIARGLSEVLANDQSMTQSELAKGVGLSKASVSESLQYLTLPASIQEILLKKNTYQRVILRRLLKCNNEPEMRTLLGEGQNKDKRSRKRYIYNIYIENGKCTFNQGNASLTPEEKENLVKTLENMLYNLKTT